MAVVCFSIFCLAIVFHTVQGACCPPTMVISTPSPCDIPTSKCTISTIPVKSCTINPYPLPKPCQCPICVNPCQCFNEAQCSCINSCPISKPCQCSNPCLCANTCQCPNNCVNSCPISKPCQCVSCVSSPIVTSPSCIELETPIQFAINENVIANNLSNLLQIIVANNLVENLPLNGLVTPLPLTPCSKPIYVL